MAKRKKKQQRRKASASNPQITKELHDIMMAIDDNLRKSEQSIAEGLKNTYELIDHAKDRVGKLGQSTSDVVRQSETNTVSQPLQNSVLDAQKSMNDAMNEANKQVQYATHANQDAHLVLEQQSMEMPAHLQTAMESVQQSINTTAAALQHGIEQKNSALEQLMAQQVSVTGSEVPPVEGEEPKTRG